MHEDLADQETAIEHKSTEAHNREMGLERTSGRSFGAFIDERYAPWAREHFPEDDLAGRLKTDFSDWLKEPLGRLNTWRIAAWRRDRLQSAAQRAAVHEQLQALDQCLSKAVEWRVIEKNPVHGLGVHDDAECLVELFSGGIGQACLREGWARVGINWTWTLGQRAVIEIPGVKSGVDHILKVHINGIYKGGPSDFQRINVAVNQSTVGQVICRGPSVYEFHVPAPGSGAGGCAEIVLNLPDAKRPMDHQDSTDDRFLALRIAKLELTPLEETRKAGESQPRAAGTGAGLFDQRAALQDMASLGSNCEFGFVQRFVGAEPMSLFRWTSAPAAKLIKALRRRFAGLDARDALNIEVNSDGEFVVEDKVYGFRHHTFVSEFDGATLERVGRNEYIRVGVLTKTLIEELREQKKLFVYHDAGESDVTVIRRLVRALKSYGDNTLLWIVAAPDPSLIGAAKLIEPGLIQGFVSGFQSGVIKDVSPHLPSWLAAAHEAHRIWCATRETQAKMRLARQTKGART